MDGRMLEKEDSFEIQRLHSGCPRCGRFHKPDILFLSLVHPFRIELRAPEVGPVVFPGALLGLVRWQGRAVGGWVSDGLIKLVLQWLCGGGWDVDLRRVIRLSNLDCIRVSWSYRWHPLDGSLNLLPYYDENHKLGKRRLLSSNPRETVLRCIERISWFRNVYAWGGIMSRL